MMKRYIALIAITLTTSLHAQEEIEYLGAGNAEGIVVSSSSVSGPSTGTNTINGSGMEAKYMEAARFLSQSTLGFEDSHVQQVVELGMESWITSQMIIPPSKILPTHDAIFEEAERVYNENPTYNDEGEVEEYYGPAGWHFNYAWWQTNMTNEDLLRQRVAFALSEILVISMNSDLVDFGEGLSDYYDVLIEHAFGNYEDLLLDVTLHPCMGYYLSHLHNPKADPESNVQPDENYAREIMQLFTIGLYELNMDGTRKLDEEGNYIPTYDNADIKEMAKIFTGLSVGAWSEEAIYNFETYNNGVVPLLNFYLDFDIGIYAVDRTVPMAMYDSFHEPGEKTLLKKHTIPAGQTGMQDIRDAIKVLINHDNTGPFLGRHLIQRLVKSNPTPAYIERVARVYEDNGRGERGDLGAMIRAILMDEEARSCEWQQNPTQGMLKEPILRYAHLYRMIPKDSPRGYFWNNSFFFGQLTKQTPLNAPTVFNFFSPDYSPVGTLTENNLVGPEFQIHDTQSSVGYMNHVFFNTWYEILSWSWESEENWGEDLNVNVDFNGFGDKADSPESLVNYLDVMLTNGRLSDDTRQIMREAMAAFDGPREKIKAALYIILVSPDYTILK